MKTRCPFSVLGILPTLDSAVIKRAYFEQLSLHPPHKDPEGFRGLRAAYETLKQPGGLAVAHLEADLDLAAAAAPYRERFDAALADARRQITNPEPPARRFFNLAARLSYRDAVSRFR
jgi:hypothetical protein